MKIHLETLGCQMNKLDSELLLGQFRTRGWDVVDEPADADAVLYNTCSVRDHAEQKVYSRLGRDAQRKLDRTAAGKVYVIAVFGCMAQRDAKEIRRRSKAVDIICAPGQIDQLPALLEAAADAQLASFQPIDPADLPTQTVAILTDPKRTEQADAVAEARIDQLDLTRDPELRSNRNQAFVRVARGCNNFCSYCIVPYVRGPERSREPAHIVDETKKLVDAGVSEITLIGQTVNRYRHTAGDVTTSFAQLLETLHEIDGLRRLRFVTSHPSGFTRDILEAMRDLPKVCEYMHIPAQHGSDRLLAAMNRGYTRAEYDALVDLAREIVPGVAFASDFIVGFPTETETEHQQSLDLIRRSQFKNSFIFKYSPRPGTVSAKTMIDDIANDVKKRRNNELLDAQREAGLAHHAAYVGQQVDVLVTGPSRRSEKQAAPASGDAIQLMGRTPGDHIVLFDAPASLVDTYQALTVTEANDLALFATL